MTSLEDHPRPQRQESIYSIISPTVGQRYQSSASLDEELESIASKHTSTTHQPPTTVSATPVSVVLCPASIAQHNTPAVRQVFFDFTE